METPCSSARADKRRHTMSDVPENAATVPATTTRLTFDDKVEIMRLLGKGYAQEQIASMVGCSQSTVSRVASTVDGRPEARMILEAGAPQLAETVLSTKDGAVALKALGKLDVVREDASGGGNHNFVLVVGQPGHSHP